MTEETGKTIRVDIFDRNPYAPENFNEFLPGMVNQNTQEGVVLAEIIKSSPDWEIFTKPETTLLANKLELEWQDSDEELKQTIELFKNNAASKSIAKIFEEVLVLRQEAGDDWRQELEERHISEGMLFLSWCERMRSVNPSHEYLGYEQVVRKKLEGLKS